MNNSISDLQFFVELVKQGSLTALAREMRVTPQAISARLSQMERHVGVRLLNRTTRSISVTPEGDMYLSTGSRLLAELEELDREVSSCRSVPRGLLKINATFGFGRRHIAPMASLFRQRYPAVQIRLVLTERPMNLLDSAFDIGIRFGQLPDSRMVGRKIASNERVLCASPRYLASFGTPCMPKALNGHQLIILRDSDAVYGNLHLSNGAEQESIKMDGAMSTNDGEIALQWALDGHGVLMRSHWEVGAYLESGRLRRVLSDWSLPDADVYAVYPERHNISAKVTSFISFLEQEMKVEGMAIEAAGMSDAN
jgi:DNA-binding transcriptional LysR family regulator